MRIGIVNRKYTLSEQWITYLKENKIPYTTVDPYAENALRKLVTFDYLLWHMYHFDPSDILEAPKLIDQIQHEVKTFPNSQELEYFDDKARQVQLFEELNIKHPTTVISNTKEDAIKSIEKFKFPFIAKLKKGAGSGNVWLIENEKQALHHIEKMFSIGISVFNDRKYLNKRLRKAKAEKSLVEGIKGIRRMLKNKGIASKIPNEKDYTLFQEMIPNGGFDIRIVVINKNKAFSARRDAQENQWTASGSGIATYPNEKIDIAYIEEAFSIARKMDSRCIAVDFVKDIISDEIYAIEVSPFYASYSMKPCTGFWDNRLNWHFEERDPQWFLIDEMLKS